jgi:hypothetical protein
MTIFWAVLLPGLFMVLAVVGILLTRSLQFFSHSARDLDQIDIPNEVKEVSIPELELLISDADVHGEPELTPWERRQAVATRLREARKSLHLIIANAALFQEVARFHIQTAGTAGADSTAQDDALPFRVMDRAAMVHFLAAVCLTRLLLAEGYRFVWPAYIPALADQFQVRGHNLITWYRQGTQEMLELAGKYYGEVVYSQFKGQLTGWA